MVTQSIVIRCVWLMDYNHDPLDDTGLARVQWERATCGEREN